MEQVHGRGFLPELPGLVDRDLVGVAALLLLPGGIARSPEIKGSSTCETLLFTVSSRSARGFGLLSEAAGPGFGFFGIPISYYLTGGTGIGPGGGAGSGGIGSGEGPGNGCGAGPGLPNFFMGQLLPQVSTKTPACLAKATKASYASVALALPVSAA